MAVEEKVKEIIIDQLGIDILVSSVNSKPGLCFSSRYSGPNSFLSFFSEIRL
jgi:hypothetical protein